jgi:hypothetical protein
VPAKPTIPELREKMRIWLGKAVIVGTGAVGALTLLAGIVGVDRPEVVTGVVSGFVGLAGLVLGFYFAGRDPG